jgi:hypothetical protein
MNATTLPKQHVNQEYGTAKGWRIFVYVLAPPLTIMFLVVPFLMWDGKEVGLTIGLSVMMLVIAAVFTICLWETHKARHIITEDSVLYRGAFRQKQILLADIKGYRVDQHYLRLFPKTQGADKIRIGYTSEDYDGLKQWFADRYPDLDVQEQQQEEEIILQDDALGLTTAQREEKLAQARKTAKVLNVASGVAAGWLFLQPQPYQWATAACLLLPLVGVAALWLHAGVLRPDERKNSAYPSLTSTLLFPSLVLLLRVMLDFEILNYELIWPTVVGVAVLFGMAILVGSREFVLRGASRWSAGLAVVAYAALYGFSATAAYNCAFDEERPAIYQTKVLSKHYSSGKTTTYYLKVAPWGPRTEAEDVTVTEDYYNRVQPGATTQIYLMPGKLQVPWFTVAE